MKIPMVRWRSGGRGLRLSRFARRLPARQLGCILLPVSLAGIAFAQGSPVVVERNGRVIALVPYAPNILSVTMSNDKATAIGAPGTGLWQRRQRRDGHTSMTRMAAMRSDRHGWWCVWRRGIFHLRGLFPITPHPKAPARLERPLVPRLSLHQWHVPMGV
jgi:hypothetical protein